MTNRGYIVREKSGFLDRLRSFVCLGRHTSDRRSSRTLPLVAGILTGDTFEAFHRNYLDGQRLADWAVELLTEGFESEAVIRAAGGQDMHWQDVRPTFIAVCRELGVSHDIDDEIALIKREAMIEEYRRGSRQGADLLHRFDDLRREIGFPGQIVVRLLEDNPDGTNDSGYYDWEYRMRGAELEHKIREQLRRAGIVAVPGPRHSA